MEKTLWGNVKRSQNFFGPIVNEIWTTGSCRAGSLQAYPNIKNFDFAKINYNDVTANILVDMLATGKILEMENQEHLERYLRCLEKLHEKNSSWIEKRDSGLSAWELQDIAGSDDIENMAFDGLELKPKHAQYLNEYLKTGSNPKTCQVLKIHENTGLQRKKVIVSKFKDVIKDKNIYASEGVILDQIDDSGEFILRYAGKKPMNSIDLSDCRYRKVYSENYVNSRKTILRKNGKRINSETTYRSMEKYENKRIEKGEYRGNINIDYNVGQVDGNHASEVIKESVTLPVWYKMGRNGSYTEYDHAFDIDIVKDPVDQMACLENEYYVLVDNTVIHNPMEYSAPVIDSIGGHRMEQSQNLINSIKASIHRVTNNNDTGVDDNFKWYSYRKKETWNYFCK